MSFDAIIFDLDNTLIDRDAALERYLNAWAPGLDAHDLAAIRAHDCHGYSPRLAFASWFANRFTSKLTAPITGPELWSHMRRNLSEFVEVEPVLGDMLARIGTRFKLGLVSNGSSLNQRSKLERSGIGTHFSSIVISQEVGMAKPAEVIFQRSLRELGVAPASALYVGDHPRADIVGASQAGLRTAWITLGRTWTHSTRPDFELDSVLQLESGIESA